MSDRRGGVTPDKGWAWLVLLAGFLSNVVFDGIIFSTGIFYMEFLDFFREGGSRTAWVGSTIGAVYALVGPVASILANRFGCRAVTIAGSLLAAAGFILSTFATAVWALIITYGVIGGVGFGLMYLCSYVMVGNSFEKRRALATGLTSCGSGVGTFVFAPLSYALIESYGWKGALWITSGIVLNGVVFGAIYRPTEVLPTKSDGSKKRKLFSLSLLRSPMFVIFCMSSFVCMIGFFVPFVYLPDFARKKGIGKERCALLLAVIGVTNTTGRISCGYVSDKPWADPLKIYNAALIIGGSATVACAWLDTYIMLVIYAAIFGFCVAAYVSLSAIILVELLGLENLSNSFGLLNMCRGMTSFIGAPLAGMLYDFTGEYDLAFYMAGSAIALAGVMCLPLRAMARCIDTRGGGESREPKHALEISVKTRNSAVELTNGETNKQANNNCGNPSDCTKDREMKTKCKD